MSDERVSPVGRGIDLCHDAFGDPTDPALVLIAGLGQQKHTWPADLAATLATRGRRVIRFDNRDVGRSTHMDYPPPNPVAILRGGSHPRQYHLGDMARDTVGLLDALGYADADLVGISMGSMIAQTVAAHFPGRVRTLTSIMSTTGARRIRQARTVHLAEDGDGAASPQQGGGGRERRGDVPPHRFTRLPLRRGRSA